MKGALMDELALLGRAQDGFDEMLASLADEDWERPSMCSEWTVRDVTGHVIRTYGILRSRFLDIDAHDPTAGAGEQSPGTATGENPLATWREARDAEREAASQDVLERMTAGPGGAQMPIRQFVRIIAMDTLVHTWDIGHALGRSVSLDPASVTASLETAHLLGEGLRNPVVCGPEQPAPESADEQTKLLAFLGRKVN